MQFVSSHLWCLALGNLQTVIYIACKMNLIGHEGGEGASNLMIVHVGLRGAQQHKDEPDGDRDFQNGLQQHSLVEPDKGHRRLL